MTAARSRRVRYGAADRCLAGWCSRSGRRRSIAETPWSAGSELVMLTRISSMAALDGWGLRVSVVEPVAKAWVAGWVSLDRLIDAAGLGTTTDPDITIHSRAD